MGSLEEESPIFAIVVIEGPDAGASLEISHRRVLVGHSSACDLCLTDCETARCHLALEVVERSLRVRDLGSKSGTVVENLSIVEARLVGDETLRIGATVFRVLRRLESSPPLAEVGAPVSSRRPVDFLDSVLARKLPLIAARRQVVEEFHRRYVARVYEENGHNVRLAAEASGIARRYFQVLRARG